MFFYESDNVTISPRANRLLHQLLQENPKLFEIVNACKEQNEINKEMVKWASKELESNPIAVKFFYREVTGTEIFKSLRWQDYACIRILDYCNYSGRTFPDLNMNGQLALTDPFGMIWLAAKFGKCGAKPDFFEDMIHLFRQFSGRSHYKKPSKSEVQEWMSRYPSGLDEAVIKQRERNKERILNIIIDKIDKGELKDSKYKFSSDMTQSEKFQTALQWWKESSFHLKFAVRSPELLNELLANSLDPDTMKLLQEAKNAGIPTFVNPYYLSLLFVNDAQTIGVDQAIRDYVIYSKQLVNEFGRIVAWEKEDKVQAGKPNAAGWILPTEHNIHRRYPEVAILIPDTMGRACGGLCSSCQRMYEFQSGKLNFNLDALKAKPSWTDKLSMLMKYFEDDSQLRDILITGGDALMSANSTIEKMLNSVYEMAIRKKKANESRKDGEKYAEIVRIRLGTRLPAYIPQRVTPELISMLADFKKKAMKIGIKQFVIQTHFESCLEVTPEAKKAIEGFLSSGWIVTNQLVFTTAASRRGHAAKLREVLNQVGVITYYTFSTKGYMENMHHFATNARSVQEQIEEKVIGHIPESRYQEILTFPDDAPNIVRHIEDLKKKENLPFLATDRNVLNLPGVGKSLTFRVIGITRYGTRILLFYHDATRNHSPIINKMDKVFIVESKSMSYYLKQLEDMGEDISEYKSIYGYSLGETEPRIPIYEYPPYEFKVTDKITNLEI